MVSTLFVIALAAGLCSYLLRNNERERKLARIPTVGKTGLFAFITGRLDYIQNARHLFKEGYEKFHGRVFKVRTVRGWLISVTTAKHLEELRRAPENVLSAREANAEIFEVDYTLGKPLHYDAYHVDPLRITMTREIETQFPEVMDEIVTAFEELLPARDEWTPMNLNPTMQQIVCRTSNRFFVGLPLCRDPDYIDLNIQFTIQAILSGQFISLFPNFLKPIVGTYLTPIPNSTKRAMRHLVPMIEERLAQEKEYGSSDWPGKPNDLLSWLLEEAKGQQRSPHDLVLRNLTINLAAIHTTSIVLSNALNFLTVYPEHIAPLREEIESVVDQYGWSKVAMGHCHKLDSFLKEAQRFNPGVALGSERKALKDFTFSDGTVIPAGYNVGLPMESVQRDERYYPDGHTFKGFRFAEMREQEEGDGLKHQLVTLSPHFFVFGQGRHACPGRWFAANELKALLAHILTTYDIKAEKTEGAKWNWYGNLAIQDNNARFLFRKRQT